MWIDRLKSYVWQMIADEINSYSRYYDRLVQVSRLPHDGGGLFNLLEGKQKTSTEYDELDLTKEPQGQRTMVLLNGVLNHNLDIQGYLLGLKAKLNRSSRLVVVAYNPYMRWLFTLLGMWGVRQGEVPFTFLTRKDLENLATISGYQVIRHRPVVHFPLHLFKVGEFLNRLISIIPLLRWMGMASVFVMRPVIACQDRPSLSVVIPARNEKGNIENALKRMPDLNTRLEIIYVEGHSSDGTYEEIQRVQQEYSDRFEIKAFQQTGKGKNDAVRLGFANATGDLLTILDADLTMPPEQLDRFYNAYIQGLADFINGNRLLYPMEGEAMRFLNRLGNIFFAKALSVVLDANLGDSLCGTKLVSKQDYQRILAWRDDFGDFDPFGDYELLFPAALMALGVADIPIHYKARTYGSTNISRFSHGWMLLKMTVIGLIYIKMGYPTGSLFKK